MLILIFKSGDGVLSYFPTTMNFMTKKKIGGLS